MPGYSCTLFLCFTKQASFGFAFITDEAKDVPPRIEALNLVEQTPKRHKLKPYWFASNRRPMTRRRKTKAGLGYPQAAPQQHCTPQEHFLISLSGTPPNYWGLDSLRRKNYDGEGRNRSIHS
jgi:hypothetical protein